jgi:hypothetical protein
LFLRTGILKEYFRNDGYNCINSWHKTYANLYLYFGTASPDVWRSVGESSSI